MTMTNRAIYLSKEQLTYAKKQGNISQFVKTAIEDYFEELEKQPQIITSGFKICSIYWTPKNEKQLSYFLSITHHTSASAFIRHAVDIKIRKNERDAEKAFREALKEPLEENEIIIGNSTVKVLRRLE